MPISVTRRKKQHNHGSDSRKAKIVRKEIAASPVRGDDLPLGVSLETPEEVLNWIEWHVIDHGWKYSGCAMCTPKDVQAARVLIRRECVDFTQWLREVPRRLNNSLRWCSDVNKRVTLAFLDGDIEAFRSALSSAKAGIESECAGER